MKQKVITALHISIYYLYFTPILFLFKALKCDEKLIPPYTASKNNVNLIEDKDKYFQKSWFIRSLEKIMQSTYKRHLRDKYNSSPSTQIYTIF